MMDVSRPEGEFMSNANQSIDVGHDIRAAIRKHWVLFLIQGVIMVILGILAVGEPMVASIAVTLFAGWLFLFSGIVGLAGLFTAHRVPGFVWALITAILAIIVGIYLIWRPLSGMVSLTLAIGAFFGAQGIVQIITAIEHRRVLRSWGWVVLTGIANVILALIIWGGFPGTADWVLGLLFGINLLLWGFSLIMTAIACRAVADTPAPTAPGAR
jgi:uncharacterized membrane protein HdeD (DUF308 family)